MTSLQLVIWNNRPSQNIIFLLITAQINSKHLLIFLWYVLKTLSYNPNNISHFRFNHLTNFFPQIPWFTTLFMRFYHLFYSPLSCNIYPLVIISFLISLFLRLITLWIRYTTCCRTLSLVITYFPIIIHYPIILHFIIHSTR